MSKTVVIHHSADWDGLFCREIARRFLPGAELIGWDFGQPPIAVDCETLYVMDLPLDAPFGFNINDLVLKRDDKLNGYRLNGTTANNLIWLDHHISAIASHPYDIAGYRIDGVAACRLAWQWFTVIATHEGYECVLRPSKEDFLKRHVIEPLAVLLAGEYDIWDHRGDGDLEFQFGLDSQTYIKWEDLFDMRDMSASGGWPIGVNYAHEIINEGAAAMRCYAKRDADIIRERSFLTEWEGLKFLCLNTARCNSNTFAARDVPETGHDALLGFFFNGKGWTVSLYHANHRKDIDLSQIAVRYGGGGHRGAAGFRVAFPPFMQK